MTFSKHPLPIAFKIFLEVYRSLRRDRSIVFRRLSYQTSLKHHNKIKLNKTTENKLRMNKSLPSLRILAHSESRPRLQTNSFVHKLDPHFSLHTCK